MLSSLLTNLSHVSVFSPSIHFLDYKQRVEKETEKKDESEL